MNITQQCVVPSASVPFTVAAGSLVVVLVWTYYSSQILFFGAELIRAYAKYFDPAPIVPTELAIPMMPTELAKQGTPPAEPDGPATK